jgi:Rieske 2Fe-2S family protein
VGEWNGFVFVNLDSDSESLKAAFADAPDLSGYGPEQLRRGSRREYVVFANWKILCENYSECYHCALVHPHLHRLSDGAGTRDPQDGVCYNGGPMSMNPGFTSMRLTGRTQRRPFNGLSEVQRTRVCRWRGAFASAPKCSDDRIGSELSKTSWRISLRLTATRSKIWNFCRQCDS